jgi:hypothetical protein
LVDGSELADSLGWSVDSVVGVGLTDADCDDSPVAPLSGASWGPRIFSLAAGSPSATVAELDGSGDGTGAAAATPGRPMIRKRATVTAAIAEREPAIMDRR